MPKGVYTRTPGLSRPAGSALRALLKPALPQEAVRHESAAEKLWLLRERLKTLGKPREYSPYSLSFSRFLLELVWTKDEARGGRVAKMPGYPYLPELCDDLILHRKLFIEKSRRVLATWTACAFDVWLAAGGQDPRWPVLLNARGNRQIYLCHRKFEDSNKYLRERVWFIISQLVERDIWQYWPDFPHWNWKEGEISATNGSLITAVSQGSDQLRGFGATFLHLEELAFWEQAKQTVESAVPVVKGGGHICAITTANSSSYAQLVRNGQLRLGWAGG